MRYPYVTADVFTSTRFGGNQLAVLPDARGLTTEQMLAITREFNYSESTFVLPAEEPGHTCRVRIFTPGGEVPFAGHPTVGTAHVLTATGRVPLAGDETRLVLGENVGPVPVTVRATGGVPTFAQLSVAQLPREERPAASREEIAAILGLAADDLLDGAYAPSVASCGLPFLLVPLRDADAVRRARVRPDLWERALRGTAGSEIMVFAQRALADADVHARVFVPGLSIPEDPATGAANAALGGYLAARTPRDGATLRWTVAQGVEMGRPSRLEIEVDKQGGGAITAVRVGGSSVLVCEGTIEA